MKKEPKPKTVGAEMISLRFQGEIKIFQKQTIMTQRNPNAGKWKLPEGYKDLGWQLNPDQNEPLKQCIKLGHNNHMNNPHWREFDNSLYQYRCTDVVSICDECKIVWHTDMSD